MVVGPACVCPWVVGICSGSEPRLAMTNTALGCASWNDIHQSTCCAKISKPDDFLCRAVFLIRAYVVETPETPRRELFWLENFLIIKDSSLLARLTNTDIFLLLVLGRNTGLGWRARWSWNFFVMGSNSDGTIFKIFLSSGYSRKECSPRRGVCRYRQMGQGDCLIAKWIGAQVFRFSSG